jgi:hypothetical protein
LGYFLKERIKRDESLKIKLPVNHEYPSIEINIMKRMPSVFSLMRYWLFSNSWKCWRLKETGMEPGNPSFRYSPFGLGLTASQQIFWRMGMEEGNDWLEKAEGTQRMLLLDRWFRSC